MKKQFHFREVLTYAEIFNEPVTPECSFSMNYSESNGKSNSKKKSILSPEDLDVVLDTDLIDIIARKTEEEGHSQPEESLVRQESLSQLSTKEILDIKQQNDIAKAIRDNQEAGNRIALLRRFILELKGMVQTVVVESHEA